ncbi:MAG: hypothetical protein PHF44_02845 [Candidatus Pacebacteria bacterium]|nr:hypothetical protein [Candidatus Paceibacterota bacterium]
MDNKEYKKIELECAVCKARFEIWISMSDYSPEQEEMIKRNIYLHCPACKALEDLKGQKEGSAEF